MKIYYHFVSYLDILRALSLNDKLTLIVSSAGLFIAILTLILGWTAYNKFLRQKLGENQMALVLELVTELYKYQYEMIFLNHDKIGRPILQAKHDGNLFRLIRFANGIVEPHIGQSPLYYDLRILKNYRFEIPALKFLSNPILPNNIAVSLKEIDNGLKADVRRSIGAYEKVVTIGVRIQDAPRNNEVCLMYSGGINNFIREFQQLDASIKLWLRQNGIKDINQHVADQPNHLWSSFNES